MQPPARTPDADREAEPERVRAAIAALVAEADRLPASPRRLMTERGDIIERHPEPAPTSVPDLNPPRSRKVARRQAAHDAKVLRRMAAEDRRAWQARRAAERAEYEAGAVVTLPDGSLSIDGRLLTIAEGDA